MTNNPKNIQIECKTNAIKLNGIDLIFPIHLNTLIKVLGEPSRQEYDMLWQVVWDDLGIYTHYGSWDTILEINFLVSNKHELTHFPKQFFNGQIIVNGIEKQEERFETIELRKHNVQQLTYIGQSEPYSISIGKNYKYTEEIPKEKYITNELKEAIIEFKDFGFKVSIIQELMYNKELLKPKFDLHEFAEWYDKRKIDIEKEGYEPIAEVTHYFKALQIPKSLATEITEIYQDGGNEIYSQLLVFGGGNEDYWDIENSDDAKNFPNLKKVTLCYAKENILTELTKIGIETEWL